MPNGVNHFYEFGPFRAEAQKRLLWRDGEPVPLTPKAFDILLALLARPGEVLSKEELMQAVWPDVAVEENNLTRNISTLRKALGEKPDEHRYIVTIPGCGYRFVAAVEQIKVKEHGVQALACLAAPADRLKPELHAAPADRLKPELHAPAPAPSAERLVSRSSRAGRAGWAMLILAALGAVLWLGAWVNRQFRSAVAVAQPFPQMQLTRLTNTGNVRAAAISPDGAHLAFALYEGGTQSLWLRQMTTAGSAQIVPPEPVIYNGLTFSPQADYVYYSLYEQNQTDEALYRVPRLGGAAPQKLLTRIDAGLSFSPDGQRCAYTSSQMAREGLGRLLIVNADGAGQQALALRRYPDFFITSERGGPAWSPDGKVIVAAVGTKWQNESWLVAVNVADGAERRLTRHPWVEVQQAVWLADGSGLLVTARDNTAAPFQIWFVSWPAGEAVRVTNDLLNYQGVSLTARSGALVTVQSERVASLWLAQSGNLSRAEQLAVAGRRNGDEGLAWTPAGEIVYCSDASGKPELWLVKPGGAGARQLTTDGRVHGPLALAPDGRSIIFTSDRTGVPHIWRMGLDGSQPQQLSEGKGETAGRLTPDGRWLIYQNTPEAGTQRLWKKPLDGGPAVQLTQELSRHPVVSPDGKLVAYFYMDAQVWGIAVLPLDGGTAARRFPLPPAPLYPMLRWTPDGQALTYVVNQQGFSNIWWQPLAGGAARPLTDFRESRLSIYSFDWSRDGRRLALARGTIVSDVVLIRDSKGQ